MALLASIGAALGIGNSAVGMVKGIGEVIDKFVETPEEKKAAHIVLTKLQQDPMKWQTEINKKEAEHRSVFIAGWRPFIGWICGIGLSWNWLLLPIAQFVLAILIAQGVMKPLVTEIPTLGAGEIIGLVLALLGMGTLRTYEKKSGVTG